ncbi:MAG: RagB/SusD family nutrient uptake outer membrane protein [Bacteroidota bacterium]|nr:RagB/SusD family nutrient uptake outer membrane protein [Bacteroidota bacterium]
MKNICKAVIILLLITLAGTSCQKDVSLTPKFFMPVTYATEAQLDAQVAGIYGTLEDDRLYGQGLWSYFTGGADEGFRTGVSATTGNNPSLYNGSSQDQNFYNFWRYLYAGIERSNIVLNVIDKTPFSSEDKRKRYKGEAKFLRAYFYYLLVSYYGDVPLKTQTSVSMGTDFNLPRNPSKDVYNYILDEMKSADTLVETMPIAKTPTIVTQSAVESILARVCLSMAGNPVNDVSKYNDALFWAQKVINSNVHSLNTIPVSFKLPNNSTPTVTSAYSRLFINNMQNNMNDNNTAEGIWDAAFLSKSNTSGVFQSTGYPVTQQLGALMGVTNPDATASSPMGYSSGSYRGFPRLFNLYGSGDLRRDWVFGPYIYRNIGTSSSPVYSATQYPLLQVSITGGNGTGASATAYTSSTGAITSVVVDNPGTGYTSAPTVTFIAYNTNVGPNQAVTGSNVATATAVVSGGKVTAINIIKGGAGYPTIYDHPIAKWRREYEVNVPPIRQQNYTSCNFPIIRYADVLLMAAEADLQVNGGSPSAQAVEYFNEVRRRAYGYSDVKAAVPGFDVNTFTMQDIMDERTRELCFEGLRYHDLVRWGMMKTAMQNVINDNSANCPSNYSAQANLSANNFLANPAKYSIFPIPNNELMYDAELTQNAYW